MFGRARSAAGRAHGRGDRAAGWGSDHDYGTKKSCSLAARVSSARTSREALLRRGATLTIVDSLDDFYSPERQRRTLDEVDSHRTFHFVQADICDVA